MTTPLIIAHRGASASVTENTISAFETAFVLGADMIETDVRLTSDGVLVLHHDPTVTGRKGAKLTIATSTFAELSAISPVGHIPTLPNLLRRFANRIPLNLELKEVHALPALTHLLSSLPDSPYRPPSPLPSILISSSHHRALQKLARLLPHIPRAPLFEPFTSPCLPLISSLSPFSVHVPTTSFPHITLPTQWPVFVYTVNDPTLARMLAQKGVAGFFTDTPRSLLHLFRTRPLAMPSSLL